MQKAQDHNLKGSKFYNQKKYFEAIEEFKNASQLEPQNVNYLNNLGVALVQIGEVEKAVSYFEKVIKLNPNFAEGFSNLGNTLRTIGYPKSAEQYLDRAIKLQPDYEGALLNLGLVAEDLGKLKKALWVNKKAAKISEHSSIYWGHIYYLRRKMCDWKSLSSTANKLNMFTSNDLANNIQSGETPFINIIRTENKLLNKKVAESWSQSLEDKVKYFTTEFSYKKSSKKIRVGYLGETFRDHPVGHCVYQMFGMHDKRRFDIYVYSYGIDDQSLFRTQVKKDADKFVDIRPLSNLKAAQKINQDKIDILVDLQGWTKDNRMEILAMRPAPIQISYLGFPGTTGGGFLDYLLTDKVAVPINEQKYFTEKIFYLPLPYQVNSKIVIPKNIFSRKDFELPKNSFVFASFNRSVKITSKVFKVWMRIMRKVPESVLWLYRDNAYAETNIKREAVNLGIQPSRLIFANRLPIETHLARLELADLALDTDIYSGGATTANALAAGIPVITAYGKHYLSRMSSSLMTAIGLDSLVVKNLREYEELAVKLATNPKKLTSIKRKVIKGEQNIFDTKKLVRNLENVYVKLSEDNAKKSS